MSSSLVLPVLITSAFASGSLATKGLVNPLGTVTNGVLSSSASLSPGASLVDGLPLVTMTNPLAGGVAPAGADFNGILNYITAFQVWSNAGGQYPFSATLAAAIGGYPLGAVLQLNGGLGCVVSTVNGNSTDPNVSMVGWVPYGGAFPAGQILVGSGTGTVGSANLTYASTLATGGLTIANTTPSYAPGTGALILNGGLSIVSNSGLGGSSGLNLNAVVTPAGAQSANICGMQTNLTYSGGYGNTGTLYGFFTTVTNNATTGTATAITGTSVQVFQSGGGTVSNINGMTIGITKSAGTVANATGLFISSIIAGSTTNYAIYTSAGIVSIGDTTASSSKTTGAMVIAGGLGVGGQIYAQAFNCPGTFAAGTFTVGATLSGAVAATMAANAPTGAAAATFGWINVNVAGRSSFIPYW